MVQFSQRGPDGLFVPAGMFHRVCCCSPGVPSVRDAVHRIAARFRRGGSGIRVVEVAKGWQMRTDVRTAPWVAAMRG